MRLIKTMALFVGVQVMLLSGCGGGGGASAPITSGTRTVTMSTSVSGMPANAYTIVVQLDFSSVSGYNFTGFIDSNGALLGRYVSTSTGGYAGADYDSVNKKLSLGLIMDPTSAPIVNGNIMDVQFQVATGFDKNKISGIVTEIKDANGVGLSVSGTNVSVSVQ